MSESRSFWNQELTRFLGKRSANALVNLGIVTVGELLQHIPFRLTFRGELLPIEGVVDGAEVTVVAQVLRHTLRPMHSRRGFMLRTQISDGEHELELTFFAKNSHPLKFHMHQLPEGSIATFSGKISSYRGTLQLTHPEYEVLESEADLDPELIAAPIPIYHASAKLPSWKIQTAVEVILPFVNEQTVPEFLPPEVLLREDGTSLPPRHLAYRQLHQPANEQEWHDALERMKVEEAFILQAFLLRQRFSAQSDLAPIAVKRTDGVLEMFLNHLPFTLTIGQEQVIAQISEDISRKIPMRRLLQGDVGAGKTIVALTAMLQMADAGKQAVLIAPTEVLARQHFVSIQKMLDNAGLHDTRIELLTGSLSAAERRMTLTRIAGGQAKLIIGTHALLQEQVQLPFLGLVVVDEQHRFGVRQRDKLSRGAHLLVMTATPIPRTIALTAFGDLQVSALTELPAGRKPIQTMLVPQWKPVWMERVWARIAEEVAAGGRVYVVCPRINADETEASTEIPVDSETWFADVVDNSADFVQGELLPGQSTAQRPWVSVEQVFSFLSEHPLFQNIGVTMMHGQLSQEERQQAMSDFQSGKKPVLVATTVIEVGVDVPEASLIVICDADRFGLSQLHQLRGRVGRGNQDSLCLAIHNSPEGTLAFSRLTAFAGTNNGFELAEADLRLRSEGNVLGQAQSGRASSLKFLQVMADGALLEQARIMADELLQKDSNLQEYPEFAAVLAQIEQQQEAEYLAKS